MKKRAAANAVRVTQTVYSPYDPHGMAIISPLTEEIGSRLAGHGGAIFIGDRGAPNQAWYGYAHAQQTFTGAAAGIASATHFHDKQSRTLESSLPTVYPGGDPARRMFADRLRRRSP